MSSIFVFTAGNAAARSHLADSIINPIALEKVLNSFPASEHPRLREMQFQGGGFYAWGAVPGPQNKPRWDQIQNGDYALCVYDSNYKYVAKILGKYDNADFAKAVWGTDPDGATWQYMYFLTEPVEVTVSVVSLSQYLYAGYMGFTKIAEDKVEKIQSEFGSVDFFIEEHIKKGAPLRETVTYWWVCQGESFTEDVGMKFIRAPLKNERGMTPYHWANVQKVKKGDVIIHYAHGHMRGLSLATTEPFASDVDVIKPDRKEKEGMRVDVSFVPLASGLSLTLIKSRKDSLKEVLGGVQGPFDINGDIKQGYLFDFNHEAAKILREIYGKPFPEPFESMLAIEGEGKKPQPIDNRAQALLRKKKQIILYGPPGTGKTYQSIYMALAALEGTKDAD
jgi:hypothetical protein